MALHVLKRATHQDQANPANPPPAEGFVVGIRRQVISLGGTVRTRAEADELIATISALKAMLPEADKPTT